MPHGYDKAPYPLSLLTSVDSSLFALLLLSCFAYQVAKQSNNTKLYIIIVVLVVILVFLLLAGG